MVKDGIMQSIVLYCLIKSEIEKYKESIETMIILINSEKKFSLVMSVNERVI